MHRSIGLMILMIPLPVAADWRVAAHAERIEPALPISMAGSMSDQIAKRIHDPIQVRAILFDNGKTSLAVALVDSCAIPRAVMDEAKTRIEEETGITAERVIIAATHSHSCPTSTEVFQSKPDASYQEKIIEGIVTSVATTQLRLEPARIGVAKAAVPEEVFNRRWRMKPGAIPPNPFGQADQVQMNPPVGSENLVEPAGPVDPDVAIIFVHATDGEPLGILANYALHYVGGTPSGEISADYFGEFSRIIGDRWRPKNARRKPVALLTNGASGDINNIHFRSRDFVAEPFGQIRRVADRVASRSLDAVNSISNSRGYELDSVLGAKRVEVELGVRRPTAEELQSAERCLSNASGRPLQSLEEIYAYETIHLNRYPKTMRLWIQTARVGSVGIVAIPCEVFVEVGIEIKKKSPFQTTIIIELANGYNGYLPTPAQHELGGYETWRARSSYLDKEASVTIVKVALGMLNELAKDAGP
jgi:neutral ceramidase